MSEPALDIHGLLHALIEQQTALLGVHAESMRLQRVLVERLLASDQTLTMTVAAARTIAARTPHDSSERIATATPAVEAVVRDESVPAVESSAPTVPAVGDGPLAESQQTTAPVSAPAPGERPALRVVGGTAGRGDRYYQSAQPTPVHRISSEGLDVLKRIQSAGEVAQLILVFGPHAGETLGQVAQSDPDYVRRLALTAQRPAVRAAAAQVVSALGEPAAPARRSRAGWRRPGSSAR
jgi:hypothetical protein